MSTDWYFGRESGDLPNYSLSAPAGILPATKTSIVATGPFLTWNIKLPPSDSIYYTNSSSGESALQMLGYHLGAFSKAPDGSETQFLSFDFTKGSRTTLSPITSSTNLRTDLTYDIGYSYVAMGEWSWGVVDSVTGNLASGTGYGNLLFVNGDRTPAAGIPASGTATYDARALLGWVKSPFMLTADFGAGTMAALIAQEYQYNPSGDILDYPLAFGIHVSGKAPFSTNGLFEIPLTGTVNYSTGYVTNSPTPPPSEPATGAMNGAFFGPHAEQVGGTFSLQNSTGSTLLKDAFVGQQHP